MATTVTDRITLSPETIKVTVTDRIQIVPEQPREISNVDSYQLVPYKSAGSIEYTLPQSILDTYALDVDTIRADLNAEIQNRSLAIIDGINSSTTIEGGVIKSHLDDIKATYVAQPAAGAYILSTELSTYDIITDTDYNTTAMYKELNDKIIVVSDNEASLTTDVSIVVDDYASSAHTLTELSASTDDIQVRLATEEGVSAGAPVEWDGIQSNLLIGMFKDVSGVISQYLGGALGPLNDGWVTTNLTRLDVAGIIDKTIFSGSEYINTSPPTINVSIGDYWVVYDIFYAAPDANMQQRRRYNGTTWDDISYDSWKIISGQGWAGGASKLITGPDGSITGYSFGDSGNGTSEFAINADNFWIRNSSNTGAKVFEVSGSDVSFTGTVTFGGTTDTSLANLDALANTTLVATTATADSATQPNEVASAINANTTTIDGGKITAGSITANEIDATDLVVQHVSPGGATPSFEIEADGTAGEWDLGAGNGVNLYGGSIYGSALTGSTVTGSTIIGTDIIGSDIYLADTSGERYTTPTVGTHSVPTAVYQGYGASPLGFAGSDPAVPYSRDRIRDTNSVFMVTNKLICSNLLVTGTEEIKIKMRYSALPAPSLYASTTFISDMVIKAALDTLLANYYFTFYGIELVLTTSGELRYVNSCNKLSDITSPFYYCLGVGQFDQPIVMHETDYMLINSFA